MRRQATSLFSGRMPMLFRSRAAALILIVAGALLLLANFGLIPRLGALAHQWWPLLLIVVGILILVRRV